jgi:hypothetical protein
MWTATKGNYNCLCGIHVKDYSNLSAALHQKTLSLHERLDIFKEGTMSVKILIAS